ncbi:MAG: sugar phosphate nucleotidyltransferase [Eubacteriales bacterium]|nr:sugar phosphate nucleotidyltransferase [Eubacteriales bacterium]
MKAVILAGGQGTRLRPMTVNVPKPMTRLLDRPVMEYILRLLRAQGICEIAVTTAYLSAVIESTFADGADLGVRLRYYKETTPLGTAGSVRQCADFLAGEDFLVISGDCVCDFDFTPALELHRARHADATIALYRHAEPLEYGLAVTDEQGLVERFVEKPAWGQVCTDTVNTGVYILRPEVLSLIPEGVPYDFSRDLFPVLLQKKTLYAAVLPGYWCDIGDCGAFLRCAEDMLDGRVRAEAIGLAPFDAPPPQFPGASVYAPSYIAPDVRIAAGAVVGPYAVLESGSTVGACAEVSHTLCGGASIGETSEVRGSILGRNAAVGARVRLEDGCVLGDGVRVGDDAVLAAHTRVWPEQEIPAGARVRESVLSGDRLFLPALGEDGRMRGPFRPEDGVALGLAMTELAAGGLFALGCDGSPASDTLLCAMEAGIRSGGGTVLRHDAPFEACARYAVRLSRAAAGAYLTEAAGGIQIAFTGADGLPPGNSARRRLEGAARRRDTPRAEPGRIGTTRALEGVLALYLAPTEDCAGTRVSVAGDSPASDALRRRLAACGAELSPAAFVEWRPSPDGLSLGALDETGCALDDAATRAIAASLTDAAFPDALARAAYLTARLRESTLAGLAAALPPHFTQTRDLPVRHPRGAVMRELRRILRRDGFDSASCDVRPLADRASLRITAGAGTAEAAAELCDFLAERVRRADGGGDRA